MERQRLWWALAAAFLVGLPCGAHSASITVDGTNCTLAEAITSANNNNAAGNGCVNGSGADTITLQVDVTLAADLPQITSTITIEGGGHFISGNNARRVLYVASSGNLTLNNTTVKDGRVSSSYGGGVYNRGTLTLTNSTVSGNTASTTTFSSFGGGIYNSGTMTLNNSTVSGNITDSSSGYYDSFAYGGGIYNVATMTLSNSTVSYNTAFGHSPNGGGIYNSGTLMLTNSTISGNTASGHVDYYDFAYNCNGGGVYNSGTLTLNNSTVSGNTASGHDYYDFAYNCNGGGIYNDVAMTSSNSTVSGNYSSYMGGGIYGGSVTLTNSTVSRNTAYSTGGGIYDNSGEITLRSSIVSGNAAAIVKEVYCDLAVIADSRNLFGHSGETSAEAFYAFMLIDGNIYRFTPSGSDINATSDGTTPTALSAILSPLADNGGPTKTHALPAGSPAINLDASCTAGQSTDQRGYSRPIGAGCDAGAFEAFVLAARTWRMTAPPCTPVPSGIGSQYGSDIPGGTYGTNWVSYKWNTATQSYGSAQAVTDALVQGTGNWLYSTIPATLTVNGTATPAVPCSNYGSGLSGNCFAINLTPSSTARWQMLGHPFPYNVSWADVRVATFNGSTWTQRTPTQAAAASIMAKEMQRWNGSSYQPKDDNVAGGMLGTLLPQEAVWVRMLPGSSAFSSGNIKLLVPAR